MDLVLDIASSVEFWRKRYPLDRMPVASPSRIPSDCACSFAEARELVPDWAVTSFAYYGVLHVLAFDVSEKRESKHHKTHIWSGAIPEGSFYELRSKIFVESPEFMFLQAASILEFETLIAFGDELCGLYSFDDRENRGFRKRDVPLTTTERIGSFLARSKGCFGVHLARKALRYVVDNSASPMETFDEMTMCLPYRYGGYGLPAATMNQKVSLTPRAMRIANRSECYLDMGYLEHKLDIEHHGKYDHSSESEQVSDRARVNGLKEMGVEVVELTKDQVNDLFAYEYIIERIARLLDKRIRKDCKGATPPRLKLRRMLFEWNASSGRIRRDV